MKPMQITDLCGFVGWPLPVIVTFFSQWGGMSLHSMASGAFWGMAKFSVVTGETDRSPISRCSDILTARFGVIHLHVLYKLLSSVSYPLVLMAPELPTWPKSRMHCISGIPPDVNHENTFRRLPLLVQ